MIEWNTKTTAQIEAETKAILKRDKKRTYFRIPGEGIPGEYRNIVAPFGPAVVAYIRKKHPTALIGNENWDTFVRGWTMGRDNREDHLSN